MLLGDSALSRAIACDYEVADLEDADRAMLDYAAKLTRDPASIEEGDVTALRDAGFDDAAILDVCQVAAYYAYVNRLADGLGVELEDGWEEDELTMTHEEFASRRAARVGTGP